MIYALIDPREYHDGFIRIENPKRVHHLMHVRRIHQGALITCLDGRGKRYRGRVSRLSADAVTINVEEIQEGAQAGLRLVLAQALIKLERFEWVVEKAVELGVSRLVPLSTERSILRLDADRLQAKCQRWQRIADESLQQCGRADRMEVEPVTTFSALIQQSPAELPLLLPTLEGECRRVDEIWESVSRKPEVRVLIGPEGDFSPKEVRLAVEKGAIPITLGPLTLRSETAAVAVLAVLQYKAGLW